MINRLKQLQGDDEQVSLIKHLHNNYDEGANNQFLQTRDLPSKQNNIVSGQATPSDVPVSLLPTSTARGPWAISQEVQQSHLVSRHAAHNSGARRYELSSHTDTYSESYELSRSSTSNFRAIDIGNSDPYKHQIDFIYYTVQPGDTLQNLSVKYSCPVASIKRLNNLWSDQEFYGLSKLKLPVGKLRLIADVINDEKTKLGIPSSSETHKHSISTLGTLNQIPITPEVNATREIQEYVQKYDDNLERTVDTDNFISSNASDFIFKNLDLNIAKARTAARSYDDNASAILQSLAESGNIVVEEDDDPSSIARREAETLLNDMSDSGLTYSGLILFIFIVCLICPLAFLIYLEETHHDSNKTP